MPDDQELLPRDSGGSGMSEVQLDASQCYRQLMLRSIGRLVYSDGALPAITPVRYAVSGSEIFFRPIPYFRSAVDSTLTKSLSDTVVALQVDELHSETGEGWAVVVTGLAVPCSTPSEWPRIAALDLIAPYEPFVHVFSLRPVLVSGQQIPAQALE